MAGYAPLPSVDATALTQMLGVPQRNMSALEVKRALRGSEGHVRF